MGSEYLIGTVADELIHTQPPVYHLNDIPSDSSVVNLIQKQRRLHSIFHPRKNMILLFTSGTAPKKPTLQGGGGENRENREGKEQIDKRMKTIMSNSMQSSSFTHGSKLQTDQLVREIQWTSVSCLRIDFINRTHFVFRLLQEGEREFERTKVKENQSMGTGFGMNLGHDLDSTELLYSFLIETSTRYRNRMLEHQTSLVQNLKSSSSTSSSLSNPSTYSQDQLQIQRELDIFSTTHRIWHLAEILYLGDRQTASVADQLRSWVDFNSIDVGLRVKLLFQEEGPVNPLQVFKLMITCVLRGHFILVLKLLEKFSPIISPSFEPSEHSKYQKSPIYEYFARIFNEMPLSGPSFKTQDLAEWQARLRVQSIEDIAVRVSNSSAAGPLFDMVKILSGNVETILKLSESWDEAFVSILLHTNPIIEESISIINHSGILDSVLDALPHHENSVSDKAVISLLRGDIDGALRYSSSISFWLAAHLADFLFITSKINSSVSFGGVNGSRKMRDWFVIQYANTLISHDSLWQVGLEYFSHCTSLSSQLDPSGPLLNLTLETYLLHIPQTNFKVLDKLLALSSRYRLKYAEKLLNRMAGTACMKKSRYGIAVDMLIKGGDIPRCHTLVRFILNLYLKTGDPNIFRDIVFAIEMSGITGQYPLLGFLVEYNKFLDSKVSNENTEASMILTNILQSEAAPKMMWYRLFLEAIPLLELETPVFDETGTWEIMRCITEMELNHRKDQFWSMNETARKDFLDRIKLACARNLAKTMTF